jgi:tRNA pseudouridine32 synthase/23S rRNA pseudouridine746 synthase
MRAGSDPGKADAPIIPGFASHVQLLAGPWQTVLEALCARFPHVSPAQWRERMEQGRVLDAQGQPLPVDAPHRPGLQLHYFRERDAEPSIRFEAQVLFLDAHLLVADKPHFLPVTPTGPWVEQTLLRRLQRQFPHLDIAPLHRLDRDTAGLVLFSVQQASRNAYHALFRHRRIEKTYEALAPALPGVTFPCERRSRLVRGEPFFRMAEQPGEPNSCSRIGVLEGTGPIWRYGLCPVTGRKHQLRVHMAALGAPVLNDRLYPSLLAQAPDDPARPLKLLARSLAFQDPVSGEPREFFSRLTL